MNNEIKRILIDKEHYTEANYPFTIEPNFSTLWSVVQITPQGPIIGFVFDDSIGSLLGFNETISWEECNLSPNPVDIFPFDKIFIECDIAQGMIFRGKISNIIRNSSMTVDPGYKYVKRFAGGITWYMMETKGFISSVNLKSKNENGELVSFNGQSVTFRLSIKEA